MKTRDGLRSYTRRACLSTAIFVATTCTFCQVPSAADPQASSKLIDLFRRTDGVFSKYDTTVSPGCALSVMKDGKILYERGYGMADLDHNVAITPETVFHVASISKQFTATAILMLSLEGKLSLDDDVHRYLPELPQYGHPITIRELLHHTSGVRDQWLLLNYAGFRYGNDLITDQDVLGLLYKQKELNFVPGDRFMYSNSGFTLLSQIVQKVSSESLRQFTTTRIFEPLGMKDTHFRDDHAEVVKRDAFGYTPASGLNVYKISITNFDTVGATGLLTTVKDLARWDANFYDQRLGGPELNKLLLTPGTLNDHSEAHSGDATYASGLNLGTYRGLRIVEHGGADAGYRAELLRFPDQHFSVACLCNRSDALPGELADRVADIFLDGSFTGPSLPMLDAAAPDYKLSPEQLRADKGLYWDAKLGHSLLIDADGDRLVVIDADGKRVKLDLVKDSTFRLEGFTDTFVFHQSPDHSGLTVLWQHGLEPANEYRKTEPAHPTEAQLLNDAGTYHSDEEGTNVQFAITGTALVLTRAKKLPQVFKPIVPDFFEDAAGNTVHFIRDSKGNVDAFTLDLMRITNLRFQKLFASKN